MRVNIRKICCLFFVVFAIFITFEIYLSLTQDEEVVGLGKKITQSEKNRSNEEMYLGSFKKGEKKKRKGNNIEVTLLRHGEAQHNVASRLGRKEEGLMIRDPVLSKEGKKQAKSVKLKQFPDVVFVSPLKRTLETARLVFQSNFDNVKFEEFIVHPDLQETNAGKSSHPCDTGNERDVLKEIFPEFNVDHLEPKWYEPYDELNVRTKRFLHFLSEFLKKYDCVDNVFVVAHHGVITELTEVELTNCESITCNFLIDESILECQKKLVAE